MIFYLTESGSIPQLQVPPPELNEVTNVSQSDEVVAVSNASASQPKQIKGQKGKTKRLQKLKGNFVASISFVCIF